jgi:hypothetical protein
LLFFLDLEKKIKKAVIISFLTKERMAHLDDRMGVHMMFAEPLQIFNPNDEEVSSKTSGPFLLYLTTFN